MMKLGFEKSLRMFRKFSDETLRRRGGNQAGRDGLSALSAIESVLKGERLFDGTLLEPLAAFTNLLQSSQLPPEFGGFSFADALSAIEEAHAEQRQQQAQIWEFSPELDAVTGDETSALSSLPVRDAQPNSEHGLKLAEFVLGAAESAQPGAAVVVGALSCPELPLAELASRFQRLTLNDLDLQRLEDVVRRTVPEPLRQRLRLERYDLTGSYVAFARGVENAVSAAASEAQANEALLALVQSYDVGAGSAGLTGAEDRADLAVSALVLSELGRGYETCIARALTARGWEARVASRGPLAPALELLRRLVEHHHIFALLRRAERSALLSAVSELELKLLPSGESHAVSEPLDLLGVERLVERLPQSTPARREQSWEWRHHEPNLPEKHSLLTLVEAVLV